MDTRDVPSNQTSPASFVQRNNLPTDLQPQPRSLSPRLLSGSRLAESKVHHRQTSIVHGIQHSRNGSYGSTSSSPLSPQIIAAAGADAFNMGESSYASTLSSMTSGTSFSSNTTFVPDRSSATTDSTGYASTQKKVDRMHSSRGSRDYRHAHSHSRHHKEELKTVGEYALHVLLTSVSPLNLYLYVYLNNTRPVYCPGGRENQPVYNNPP